MRDQNKRVFRAKIASRELLRPHEPLFLRWDAQNELDPTALAVRTRDYVLLGYLPACLSREMCELLSSLPPPQVFVVQVNPPPAGVHHRLLCRVDGCWPEGYIPFSTVDYQPINTDATDIRQWFESRMVLAAENSSKVTPGSVTASSNI